MELQFKILSNSNKGPTIIEHENSIGCNFHISEKYKESLIILENFIAKKLNNISVMYMHII